MPLVTLLAILSISLCINMPGIAVSPMLGKLQKLFHASVLETQLITSLPNLVMIPLILIAGAISTIKWRTAVVTTGLAIFLVAGVGCFFANSMGMLIFLGCMIGVGCALIVPLAAGYISEWFTGSDRQSDLGLKSAVSNGMIIIANIYVGIVVASNWHAAFAVYLIPIIPLCLVPFLTQKFVRQHRQGSTPPDNAPVVKAPMVKNSVANANVKQPTVGTPGADIRFTPKQSRWLLCGVITLYMFVTFTTMSITYYAPFVMDKLGMSTSQVGIVTAMYFLMCSTAGVVVGRFRALFGPATMYVSLAMCAAGLFLMGFTSTLATYIIGALITGFGYGIIQPIIYNKTTYIAPDGKSATRYFGYVLSANYVAVTIVPFVGELARRITGSTAPAFQFWFSAIVVCAVMLWAVIARRSYVFTVTHHQN